MHLVHVANVADDFGTFFNRDDGSAAFGLFQHVVVNHPGDEVVAVRFCLAQDVQVADVEKVVGAGGVSDGHGVLSWVTE